MGEHRHKDAHTSDIRMRSLSHVGNISFPLLLVLKCTKKKAQRLWEQEYVTQEKQGGGDRSAVCSVDVRDSSSTQTATRDKQPPKKVKDILTLKNHSLGKQARFDSCFCLPDFKLCSGTISHHAYSLLCAILKSTNDLSYRTIE